MLYLVHIILRELLPVLFVYLWLQVQHPGLPGDVRAQLDRVRAAVVGDAELARWSVVCRRCRRIHDGPAVLHRDPAHDRLRFASCH